MHHSRQQWLVAQWLGLSFTVRVRASARLLRSFFLFVCLFVCLC